MKIMIVAQLICSYQENGNGGTYFCKASNSAFQDIFETWNFDQKNQAILSSYSNKQTYFIKDNLKQYMNNCLHETLGAYIGCIKNNGLW
jgi:hypothetical protein